MAFVVVFLRRTGIDGGGIYNTVSSTVTLDGDATISDNTAGPGTIDGRGGGIFNATGTVTLDGDAAISGNTATRDGGGIYISTGTLEVNGSLITSVDVPAVSGNTAPTNPNIRFP